MNTINVENCKTLLIGRRGENEVTTVAFDFAEWQTEFGSGVVDLYVKRFGDDSAYPVVLTIDGTIATWTVTATDTNVAGYGKAEYVYRVDGKIAKSAVFPFFVAEDIGQPASEPPDPYESWLDQLTALGAETEAHAQAAEQSAEDAAESAEDAAQSAASAEGYAGQAETAAGLAQAAQTASEAARDAAQTAQAIAEASATAASGSAASAASSATAAAGSASDASASATAAGGSATTASTAATQAEAAKTAAQTAQSAAEDAAEDAQQAAQQAHVEYEQLSGEVDDLSDEVSQQKSAIEDLEALTNRKAGALIDTASGSIASFVPDSTIDNLLGVSVDIEPVQDLHGYGSPWPSGGGKNLLGNFRSGSTINGIAYSINADGSIHASGTATAQSNFYFYPANTFSVEAGTYTLSVSGSNSAIVIWGGSSGTAGIPYSEVKQANPMTFTSETGGIVGYTILRIPVGVTVDADILIQLERGSTATAWSPYENLCPISGWDAVEVERTGVNLLDAQAAVESSGHPAYCKIEDGYLNFLTGDASRNGLDWRGLSFPTPLTFVMSVKNFGSSANVCRLLAYYDDGTYDQFFSAELSSGQEMLQTYTIPANGKRVVRIKNGWTSGIRAGINLSASQIELGSTATNYHTYAGNRYTIALGQTVYGAKMTISEDGSVTALVDMAMVVITGGMIKHSSLANAFYRPQTFDGAGAGSAICNMFTYSTMAFANLSDGFFTIDRDYTRFACKTLAFNTADEFNAFLANNPLSVAYPLATPIVIQLDPVTISTISGQTNNVWADAGNLSVEFAVDIKAYIDSKIAAAVAALS